MDFEKPQFVSGCAKCSVALQKEGSHYCSQCLCQECRQNPRLDGDEILCGKCRNDAPSRRRGGLLSVYLNQAEEDEEGSSFNQPASIEPRSPMRATREGRSHRTRAKIDGERNEIVGRSQNDEARGGSLDESLEIARTMLGRSILPRLVAPNSGRSRC